MARDTVFPSSWPVDLAYNTHESAAGTDESLAPILYLHGATAFKETWDEIPQVVANTTRRKSYSLDARNHGDSGWSGDFNFDVNVVDLFFFMDIMGIRKAVLVGHSMGGVTAIKAALQQPDRVEAVVIEDMFVRKCSKEMIDTVRSYISIMRQAIEKASPHLGEEGVKMFVRQYFVTSIPRQMVNHAIFESMDDGLDTRSRFLALRRGEDGRWQSKCNLAVLERAMQNPDTLACEPKGRFDGPACFIYGKMSPFLVGIDEHHIKQFFPKAVFVGIEDAHHSVHSAKPLEFTDALLKFLS